MLTSITGIIFYVVPLIGWVVTFSWFNKARWLQRYGPSTRFLTSGMLPGIVWAAFAVFIFIHIPSGSALLTAIDRLSERLEKEKESPSGSATKPTPEIESRLAIEGVNDPLFLIPQENQPVQPKVTKFARIRVLNVGSTRVENVQLVMTRLNDQHTRLQLPIASMDTLFRRKSPAPIEISTGLNPGDDQHFEALVECNGTVCPKGVMAVPAIENRRRLFKAIIRKGEAVWVEQLAVRASGNAASAVTKTFAVYLGVGGQLLLEAKTNE